MTYYYVCLLVLYSAANGLRQQVLFTFTNSSQGFLLCGNEGDTLDKICFLCLYVLGKDEEKNGFTGSRLLPLLLENTSRYENKLLGFPKTTFAFSLLSAPWD